MSQFDSTAEAFFEGYHGSSEEQAVSIVESGTLNPSLGSHHWYGEGSYFFVQGISDPADNARNWSIAQAWCNKLKMNKYERCGVLLAHVTSRADRVVDLRDQRFAELFQKCREKVLQGLTASGKRKYSDSMVFGYIRTKIGADIFIGNQYIKFKEQRKFGFNSQIPNVSMMCVTTTPYTSITNINVVWVGGLE